MQYQSLPNPQLAHGRGRAQKHNRLDKENTAEDAIAYEHFRATFSSDCFYSVKKSRRQEEAAGPAELTLTRGDLLDTFFVPLDKCLKDSARQLDRETQKRLQLEITGDEAGLPLSLEAGSELSFNFVCAHAESTSEPVDPTGLAAPRQVALQSRNTRLVQAGEYVLFRVVDAYPGRRKRLRTDLMKSIASSQLAVTVHDVVNCDADVRVVTVSLQAKGSESNVSRLFDGTHDTSEILKWDTADDIVWLWRGHEEEVWLNSGLVPAALTRLFAAKAWEGVGHLAISEQEPDLRVALQALQRAGLVSCSEGEGVHEQWQLCDHARASLYCGARLQNAAVAMQIREGQPVHSMTTWEYSLCFETVSFSRLLKGMLRPSM